MKIIGEHKNGFILEATRNEVANVFGYYSEYSHAEMDKDGVQIKVGADIPVSKIFRRLHDLRSLTKEFATIAASFRGFAEYLDKASEVIPPEPELTEFKVTQESGVERVAVFYRKLTAEETRLLDQANGMHVFDAIVRLMGGEVKP